MLQAPNLAKKDGRVKQNNSLQHHQNSGSTVLSSGKFSSSFLKKLNWLVSVTLLNKETMTTHSITNNMSKFTSLLLFFLFVCFKYMWLFLRNNWHRTSVLEPTIDHPNWVLILV